MDEIKTEAIDAWSRQQNPTDWQGYVNEVLTNFKAISEHLADLTRRIYALEQGKADHVPDATEKGKADDAEELWACKKCSIWNTTDRDACSCCKAPRVSAVAQPAADAATVPEWATRVPDETDRRECPRCGFEARWTTLCDGVWICYRPGCGWQHKPTPRPAADADVEAVRDLINGYSDLHDTECRCGLSQIRFREAVAILTSILDRLARAEGNIDSTQANLKATRADWWTLHSTAEKQAATIADLRARLATANGLIAQAQQAIAGCHDLQLVVPALGKLAEYKP